MYPLIYPLEEPIPPLVKKALVLKYENDGRDDPNAFERIDLQDLHAEFERKQAFKFCKDYGLLDKDNSGEEFALEFMEYFNQFDHYY